MLLAAAASLQSSVPPSAVAAAFLVPSEPFPALWGRSPVPFLSFYLGFGFSDSRGSLAAGEV